MKMTDSIKTAADNLKEKKVRAALCMLSVAVGAASLFLISAIGVFGRTQLDSILETLGVSGYTMYAEGAGGGPALSASVVADMEASLPQVTSAMPIQAKMGNVFIGTRSEKAAVLGVTEKLSDVMALNVLHGALFNAQQASFGEKLAVIDNQLAMETFGRENVVGRKIRIRVNGADANFTVAAVIEAQTSGITSTLGAFVPNLIYVPYGCMAQESDAVDQVFVQCMGDADAEDVKTQITSYLTSRKQILGAIRIESISQMIDSVNHIADLVTVVFLAIGLIALFVALIGVLCSMLSATHEKTREIGIYLALGARGRDIIGIFLWQSVLICLFGGVIGIAFAALGMFVLSGGAMLLSVKVVLGVTLVCTLCGVLAGLLPAWRASRLCPVDAFRQ